MIPIKPLLFSFIQQTYACYLHCLFIIRKTHPQRYRAKGHIIVAKYIPSGGKQMVKSFQPNTFPGVGTKWS